MTSISHILDQILIVPSKFKSKPPVSFKSDSPAIASVLLLGLNKRARQLGISMDLRILQGVSVLG